MNHPPQGDPRSDAELISSVRSGDPSAFGVLFERHGAAVRTVAGYYAPDSATADDLTSEAFERMLATLRSGHGPDVSFRAYVYTVVRRLALEHAERGSRVHVTDDFSPFEGAAAAGDTSAAGFEAQMVSAAFASLPERWQAVLWYLEVEGMRPAEIGSILGLSANGVSALAYRARDALRAAYLQAHVSQRSRKSGCAPVRGRLGAWVAGGLSARDSFKVESHVRGCDECTVVADELGDVGRGLRAIVAPLILGGAAAAGLTAAGGGGGGAAAAASVVAPHAATATGVAAMTGAAAAVIGVVAIAGIAVSPVAPSASSQLVFDAPVEAAAAPRSTPAPSTPPSTPVPHADEPDSERLPAAAPAPAPTQTPADPADLSLAIDDLGDLVLGREGMVGATVSSTQTVDDVRLRFELPAGVDLDTARGSGDGSGWTCVPSGADALCSLPTLAAGETRSVSVPVEVAVDADTATPPAATLSADDAPTISAASERPVLSHGLGARFVATGSYGVALAGSSFLDCDSAAEGCLVARDFVGDPQRTNNQAWALRVRGASTPESSLGLEIPSGARVVFAGLYWSATTPEGVSDAQIGSLGLVGPDLGVSSVTASRVDHALVAGADRYQAFADVTDLVAAHGGGAWAASGALIGPAAPAAGGASVESGTHAGWSLVVVYADPSAAPSRVSVLDGFELVADEPIELDVVRRGSPEVSLGFVAWEGDAGSAGDGATLAGAPLLRAGFPEADNIFRSVALGSDVHNTFGVDVGWLEPAALASPRARLTFETGGDQVGLGALVAVVPVR